LKGGRARPAWERGVEGENPAIIQKNIEHYRHLLTTETDAAKRAVIAKLLEEAIQKLRESGA
jgi:hypothetical protein